MCLKISNQVENFKPVWKIQSGLKKFKPKIKLEPQHIFPQDIAEVQYPVFFIPTMILRIFHLTISKSFFNRWPIPEHAYENWRILVPNTPFGR